MHYRHHDRVHYVVLLLVSTVLLSLASIATATNDAGAPRTKGDPFFGPIVNQFDIHYRQTDRQADTPKSPCGDDVSGFELQISYHLNNGYDKPGSIELVALTLSRANRVMAQGVINGERHIVEPGAVDSYHRELDLEIVDRDLYRRLCVEGVKPGDHTGYLRNLTSVYRFRIDHPVEKPYEFIATIRGADVVIRPKQRRE